MTHEAFRMWVLKIRGRRVNLLLLAHLFLLTQRRSIRLLLRKNFRDKAMTIRAKAKVNHPKMGGLLASQGRGYVTIITSLDT